MRHDNAADGIFDVAVFQIFRNIKLIDAVGAKQKGLFAAMANKEQEILWRDVFDIVRRVFEFVECVWMAVP